jgi:hypothetical protein
LAGVGNGKVCGKLIIQCLRKKLLCLREAHAHEAGRRFVLEKETACSRWRTKRLVLAVAQGEQRGRISYAQFCGCHSPFVQPVGNLSARVVVSVCIRRGLLERCWSWLVYHYLSAIH